MTLSPKQIMERINASDIVLVLGGNTDWLKIVFDKIGISKELPKILENKLYIGNSAGSMIIAHRPSNKIQEQIYGENNNYGNKTYLDLLDFSILPHCFSNDKDKEIDWIKEESESVNYPIYAISDNAAVVVSDNKISFIGSDYIKIS